MNEDVLQMIHKHGKNNKIFFVHIRDVIGSPENFRETFHDNGPTDMLKMMKGYYDTIPFSLEESALVDGAGRFRAFSTIILPLAAPALVITALFSFMSAWNEYIVAAQVMLDDKLFTLPVGLKSLQGNMSTEWGMYAAGSLLVSIPVVILFLSLSRWLVSGLTLGSVKG
jgi:arabinogalactan oligomer/maltooligosaccharide transport system permease protein